MSQTIPLTLALHEYDHVRDLVSGAVGVEGVSLTCLQHPVEEIFFRFTRFREWGASELSLAKYCSLRASGDDSLVAIPVFTSRAFRHSAIFVRADGPVDDPRALRGGRIGVPEWTQTATVYARGLLAHEFTSREEREITQSLLAISLFQLIFICRQIRLFVTDAWRRVFMMQMDFCSLAGRLII